MRKERGHGKRMPWGSSQMWNSQTHTEACLSLQLVTNTSIPAQGLRIDLGGCLQLGLQGKAEQQEEGDSGGEVAPTLPLSKWVVPQLLI